MLRDRPALVDGLFWPKIFIATATCTLGIFEKNHSRRRGDACSLGGRFAWSPGASGNCGGSVRFASVARPVAGALPCLPDRDPSIAGGPLRGCPERRRHAGPGRRYSARRTKIRTADPRATARPLTAPGARAQERSRTASPSSSSSLSFAPLAGRDGSPRGRSRAVSRWRCLDAQNG